MRLLFFLGLFAILFSGEVIADTPGEALVAGPTNPAAIELCRGLSVILKNECLKRIKDQSFEFEAIDLCKRLRWDTAKTLCLFYARNEPFPSKALLEACYDPNDWIAIDCIKGIIDKPKKGPLYRALPTILDFTGPSIYYGRGVTAQRERVKEGLKTHAFLCSNGYRDLVPVNPHWESENCWDPDYRTSRCRVKVRCIAE